MRDALQMALKELVFYRDWANCRDWRDESQTAILAIREALYKTQILNTPELYQFKCEVEGVELDCRLEYEPLEENYPDAPDIEECMNLVNAYTNGVDIAHLLMQSIVDHICESALEDMKENSNDY